MIKRIVPNAAQEDGAAGDLRLDEMPTLAGEFGGAAQLAAAIGVHEETGFD
jgi:hypothetical protein